MASNINIIFKIKAPKSTVWPKEAKMTLEIKSHVNPTNSVFY